MYRDSMAERQARGLARLRTAIDEAEPLFKRSVGERASARLMKALAGAKVAVADFALATRYELDRLDQELDGVDAAIAACVAEEARRAEHFVRYQRLGTIPRSSDIVHDPTTLQEPLAWGQGVRDAFRLVLPKWTAQLPPDVVIAPHEAGIEIYFETNDHPFRLELVAKLVREDPARFTTEIDLVTPVRTDANIDIRPQTFADDVLLAVHLRREVVLGDDAFDPLYFVSGHEYDVRALLTTEARAAFVAMAQHDAAHVSLDGGLATMRLDLHRLARACALLSLLA